MVKKIILAIDALEYNLVEKFDCENLKQKFYGKTDISEFSQPRTIVLWSSFLSGKNKEKEILKLGDEKMWEFKVPEQESFLKRNYKVIDLPAFSYEKQQHKKERQLLKQFFLEKNPEKSEQIKEQYNSLSLEHHKKIKQQFLSSLNEDYDLLICYFSVIDVIGHVNFGNQFLMKMLYKDLDDLASIAGNKTELLILSDHGMKSIGKYGDHSNYGFWSFKKDLKNPKITDFFNIIKKW